MIFIIEFWHWLALALIFIVVEALLVSGVFAAFTVAGLITGVTFYVYPDLGFKEQLVIFATSSFILFYIIRYFFADKLSQSAEDNASTSKLVGKELVLERPIQNGFGEVIIDGVNWAVKGADQKAGTTVKVVGTDGHCLSVYHFTTKKVDSSLK